MSGSSGGAPPLSSLLLDAERQRRGMLMQGAHPYDATLVYRSADYNATTVIDYNQDEINAINRFRDRALQGQSVGLASVAQKDGNTKKMTIQEELQKETDAWLNGI